MSDRGAAGATVTVLVVAKAPRPGQVKTRLAEDVGHDAAARIAAAALLDTLDAVAALPGARGHLALAGDLDGATDEQELRRALAGWRVTPQRGDGFAERLVAAHEDAGPGLVVQIGMDTPQVTADLLATAAAGLAGHDAALGPATDGGWWGLVRRDPQVAAALHGVRMSTERTGADTQAALEAAGHRVATLPPLHDVDTVADAVLVADEAPRTRFAAAWRELGGGR